MKKILLTILLVSAVIGCANAQAPSISALTTAFKRVTNSNPKPVADMLDAAGYTYRFCKDYGGATEYVYSKNCKVIHEEHSNGIEYVPSRATASASIVTITAQGNNMTYMSVQIYTKAGFRTWVSQLKALGYRTTADSGAGNRGQAWEYVAAGKPKVVIWNDYSNTYVLSMSR